MKKSELIKLIKETLSEEKKKGLDGKACWDGYKLQGTKMKGGKRVDNCVPIKEVEAEDDTEFTVTLQHLLDKHVTKGGEVDEIDASIKETLMLEVIDENITEAKYKGKTVTLNKPMRGDSKKFKVYVNSGKKNADGSIKVKKVNFGHGGTSAKRPTMRIRKSDPKRRKAFRARHRCDNPGPKTMARYWSCKKW